MRSVGSRTVRALTLSSKPLDPRAHLKRAHSWLATVDGTSSQAITPMPWRAVGEQTYPLDRLDAALADAEAMRITKALVDPWAIS